MKTFTIKSLGCKVNQYEIRQIAAFLKQMGLKQVNPAEKPELALIHSCCVTATASSKTRQLARKIKRQSPAAKVVITGCLPSAPKNERANLPTDTIFIEREKNIAQNLTDIIKNQKSINSIQNNSKPANTDESKPKSSDIHLTNMPPANDFAKQTRAFLKLQDGCDAYCTYCIIPKIRKNVCSIPPKNALQQAKILIDAGHTEIVLTGIYLGAYGRNTTRRKNWQDTEDSPLADFIEKLADLQGLQRIRLSSLEPGDINETMLKTLKNHTKVMPHLHLPLQSGSDNILTKMARQYRTPDFRQVIQKARATLDRPAITTDIIVGFPGETDEDFAQTLKMAEFAQFSKIHIFPFSPRRGTAAANMKPALKSQIIKDRAEKLTKIGEKLAINYKKQFIGEKIGIIIENEKKQIGRCERYFEVQISPNTPRKYKKGQLIFGTLKMEDGNFFLSPSPPHIPEYT